MNNYTSYETRSRLQDTYVEHETERKRLMAWCYRLCFTSLMFAVFTAGVSLWFLVPQVAALIAIILVGRRSHQHEKQADAAMAELMEVDQ